MNASPRAPTLRLLDYYVIEGLNAFAATTFLLGIFFWARVRFDYTATESLALGALQGLGHMIGSHVGGPLSDRWGYNRTVVTGIAVIAVLTLTAWLPDLRLLPFLVIAAYSAAIGLTWPALEGGAMHLPGTINMPQRLGIYNLVWSFTGTAGFALSGWLFEHSVNAIFWIPGLIHLAQLIWIGLQRGRHPIRGEAAMALPHLGDHTPPARKQQLTRMSWLSNSTGYFLVGGFSALTPFIGERLGLSPAWSIWLGCLLLLARAVSFIVLYRWSGWHYHPAWSHYALWSAPAYLAVVFFADHLAVTATACALLGFSLGLSYYMSIYYTLDASEHKGAQGGRHEALIGLGILLGPLVGAVGGAATGSTPGAMATLIAAALVITAAGAIRISTARNAPSSPAA